MNMNDLAIDIIRDADGDTPDRYFVVGDGSWFWTREEAEQRQRTLFINHADCLAKRAAARTTPGAHP